MSGDVVDVKAPRMVALFLGRADIDAQTGCWNWTGAKHERGYGIFTYLGKPWRAHRLAYKWWNGPLDPALVIDHLCRNTSCVNPDHLEQVTQRENLLRGDTWNRAHTEGRYCGHVECRCCRGRFAAELEAAS